MNAARIHFETLPDSEKRAAIGRLSKLGHSAWGIASATGLSVEAVRQLLQQMEAQVAT